MNETPKPQKDLGIELFRIVAMFLIVLLHVLGQGGILGKLTFPETNYKIAWFLETLGYCSVNCYALISGYVGVKSRFRFRRIVFLWLEVIFITLSTTALFSLTGLSEVTRDNWLTAAFPLVRREYWYFNAYALLFPFLPVLNRGLTALGRKTHLLLMGMLFLLTSILTIPASRDIFALSSGYSALWLAVMYVFGAYFRLYGIPRFAKRPLCLVAFFLLTGAAWGTKMFALGIEENGGTPPFVPGTFIGYLSPFMVLMAISLLFFFVGLPIRTKAGAFLIKNLGAATFGVFLTHVGTMGWNYLSGRFAFIAEKAPLKLVLLTLLSVLAVYLICSLYSLLRILLFRVLGINRLVDRIADKIKTE